MDELTPYDRLSPELILDAVESAGLDVDGRLLALNSYENRVYQVGVEDSQPVVTKFYRPGRWSDAAIEEEHALELRTRDRERKLLKKVEQSIARIDAGDYGYCDETGEPIGVPRLIARPTANLSLEAQERREKRQKLMGD